MAEVTADVLMASLQYWGAFTYHKDKPRTFHYSSSLLQPHGGKKAECGEGVLVDQSRKEEN